MELEGKNFSMYLVIFAVLLLLGKSEIIPGKGFRIKNTIFCMSVLDIVCMYVCILVYYTLDLLAVEGSSLMPIKHLCEVTYLLF